MIDFGTVKPGRTLYVPFDSFAGSTGASITLSGLAVTDIEVYKDGSTTQRASDNGYTLLDTDGIDFDGLTGIHGFSINLADNSDAGFYASGSRYFVVVSSVTVDTQTVSFVACTFSIGHPDAVLSTTIATLSTQTSFTLTAGPAEDDALNGMWAIIHDVASAVQMSIVQILDYTGSTKTVTLAAGATFTAAATDNILIMGPMPMQPATTGRKPVVDASGLVDANTVNVGPSGSGTAQTAGNLVSLINTVDDFLDTEIAAILAAVDTEVAAILADTNELQTDWTDGGRLDLLLDATLADTNELQTDWANGGRLDNILDARASQTSVDTVDDFLDTEIAAILAAVDTEVAAIKAKTDNLPSDPADASDIAALIGAVDDFVDTEVAAIKAVTDALGATAAARLKLSAETMLPGTVDNTGFSPTTTQFEADDITEATADHFNGRIVIFTSGALQYQATDITDYSLASGRGHFTVTALTEAPANDVTFIIV